MSVIVKEASKAISRADERAPISSLAKANLRKIFPDHWSFMLGEVALYCFVILIVTGVFLTFFYKASPDTWRPSWHARTCLFATKTLLVREAIWIGQ